VTYIKRKFDSAIKLQELEAERKKAKFQENKPPEDVDMEPPSMEAKLAELEKQLKETNERLNKLSTKSLNAKKKDNHLPKATNPKKVTASVVPDPKKAPNPKKKGGKKSAAGNKKPADFRNGRKPERK
jgi:hypothetical protein